MLFEDGYNIRKRKFFQNIMYINLYGIFGTIVNFCFIFGVIYAFNHYSKPPLNLEILTSVSNVPLELKNWQIIVFASVMCSIDTVVPEKIVNPERYPKLFSIIFGESIIKDTITVTLFDTVISIYEKQGPNTDIEWSSRNAFLLIGIFLEVFVCSILIGIIAGLFTTLIFKHMRFLLAEKGVAEVALILVTGYSAYILSEWGHFSGVISMLFCGITLSHFNTYNLSPEGKVSSKITVSMLALIAVRLLFLALCIMMFDVQVTEDSDATLFYSFSWNFVLIALVTVIIARLLNVYLMSLIGYLIVGKKKWRLNRFEYEILSVSGFVKGVIPFALILSLPESNTLSSNSIQNTTIIIVFLTSFVFNSIMPKILRHRQTKIREMFIKNSNHPSLFDSLLVPEGVSINFSPFNNENSRELSDPKMSQFFTIKRLKGTTQKYWRRIEEGFLKPKLIYNYEIRKD